MRFKQTVRLCVTPLVIGVLWFTMTGTVSWHEALVGVFGLVLTMTFILVAFAGEKRQLQFRLPDLLLIWRTPGEVVRGAGTLLSVFVQSFRTPQGADLFRYCGMATAKDDPVLASRRVLTTLYGSIAPDTIVVGTDYAQSRLLLHQLRRAPVSETLQKLGARP